MFGRAASLRLGPARRCCWWKQLWCV